VLQFGVLVIGQVLGPDFDGTTDRLGTLRRAVSTT
jgi:hypothetical protein